MRLRTFAAAATAALAAAVALPGSAVSAAVPGCHLNGPTKVVVDSATEKVTWGFGPDCMEVTDQAGAAATWDLEDPSGNLVKTIGLEIPHPLAYEDSHTFADTAPKGRYTATPTGIDPSWLTQNAPVLVVKYGSKLATTVTRSGTGLSWTATPYQWSGASHTWVKRRVLVALFHQTSSTAPWKYVKGSYTYTASATAHLSVGTTTAGNYRLVVAETPTVWASYSTSVKGRV
jgi:hypothetical protein